MVNAFRILICRIWDALDDSSARTEYGNWLTRSWCRFTGHKCGPVWFNPCGDMPDMHCKGCGEYIG